MNDDPRDRFLGELRQELRTSAEETRRQLEALAQRFDAVDDRFLTLEANLRGHIDRLTAETRRHVGVIAESLQSKLELVIEGLTGVDQKVAFPGEFHGQLGKIDTRLAHMTARISKRRKG